MFNLEIITRILNFGRIIEILKNVQLILHLWKELLIRKKKKRKERKESTCLIKFYGSYLS